MLNVAIQYPCIHQKSNARYHFYDDNGIKHEYVAGVDGITEEFIKEIKRLDFEYVKKTRHENSTVMIDGKIIPRVLSLDSLAECTNDNSMAFEDACIDIESDFISAESLAGIRRAITKAWNTLKPGQKELYKLAFEDGLSYEEIARLKGIAHQVVSKRMRVLIQIFVKHM